MNLYFHIVLRVKDPESQKGESCDNARTIINSTRNNVMKPHEINTSYLQYELDLHEKSVEVRQFANKETKFRP